MGWSREEGWASVFEPLVRGGPFNFQLPIGAGRPVCFFMGTGIHLTLSTTMVTPFEQ